MRRTRRDGNCFYRAFAFGYLERNLKNTDELARFRQLTYDLKDQLVKLGYQEFTVEDVRDVVIEIIDNVRQGGDEASLVNSFCSIPYSDYYVAYLRWVTDDAFGKGIECTSFLFRLFTSAYLQMNREFFENFIEDGKSVKQFCSMVSFLSLVRTGLLAGDSPFLGGRTDGAWIW